MRFFLKGEADSRLVLTLITLFGCATPAAAQSTPDLKQKSFEAQPEVKQIYRHSSGWSFRAPKEWTVQVDAQEQFKLTPSGADANGEGYGLGYTPGPKISDVTGAAFIGVMEAEMKRLLPILNRTGEPQRLTIPFGPAAVMTWGGTTNDGTTVRARTYTAPFADGAISLIALGTPANLDKRDADLRTVFASLRREALPKEDTDSALAKTWRQRLSGKKLTQIESYNSGSSGGYNSRMDIVLRTDGRITFAKNSSVSIYVEGASGGSSGEKKGGGTWRIFSRGSQVLLAVTPEARATEFFVLSENQGKTLLNGRRWFVTAP